MRTVYISVFLLTVFDAIATWYGVTMGYITEGNAMIRQLFEISIPGTCLMVVIVTGALLYWISTHKYRWIPYAMMGVLAIKLLIAALHVAWISYL
jgi:hypothetical protein